MLSVFEEQERSRAEIRIEMAYFMTIKIYLGAWPKII
jgi:hypothetical protein